MDAHARRCDSVSRIFSATRASPNRSTTTRPRRAGSRSSSRMWGPCRQRVQTQYQTRCHRPKRATPSSRDAAFLVCDLQNVFGSGCLFLFCFVFCVSRSAMYQYIYIMNNSSWTFSMTSCNTHTHTHTHFYFCMHADTTMQMPISLSISLVVSTPFPPSKTSQKSEGVEGLSCREREWTPSTRGSRSACGECVY